MKAYPILFSAPEVRAILEGRKSQTRRVMKPQPYQHKSGYKYVPSIGYINLAMQSNQIIKCPYGVPGDRLWVRETHYKWTGCGNPPNDFCRDRCYADHPNFENYDQGCCLLTVSSIQMPRWASRITLEVVSVRARRLHEISEADALAEGADYWWNSLTQMEKLQVYSGGFGPVGSFRDLWDSFNSKRGFGWDVNPWVWVVEFKRIEARP